MALAVQFSRKKQISLLSLYISLVMVSSCIRIECLGNDPTCHPEVGWILYFSTADSDFQLPDSGQFRCSSGVSGDSAMSSCPQTILAQDGDYADVPYAWKLSLTDNGETVTDTNNSMIWQKCTAGQSTAACTGTASNTYNQTTAAAYCSSLTLTGRNWRLPSIRELLLFPDYNYTAPAVDDNDLYSIFLNHPSLGSYKTATPNPQFVANSWVLDLQTGSPLSQSDSTGAYVRCVSGTAMPDSSFTDNSDGTITDSATRLVFTKCSMDTTGTGTLLPFASNCAGTVGTTIAWLFALQYCENLSLAGHTDWRLPNVRELMTIVKFESSASPYIDATAFPNTITTTNYWTSTTDVSTVANAWSVNFNNGYFSRVSKASATLATRCVRGP